MTSTTIGLPDRYRPLDQVGPEEQTSTGVIHSWRAKDRVLNRDVLVRVHAPAGAAAHDWITRALTAGGLANPALAMVYDAAEGHDDPQSPGAAAYVVNEWIEGETLAERLTRGPLADREVRPLLRRLADGVAEAHRVGLAVGGLTPENVVLRPNGLVGLRGVPSAHGTIEGDIVALGDLLEVCLTGGRPGAPTTGAPDLVALARRARSTEPGQALSSVAAMAALLAERPRSGGGGPATDGEGRRRRTRDRRGDAATGRRAGESPDRAAAPPQSSTPAGAAAAATGTDDAPAPDVEPPVALDPTTRPPVPRTRPSPAVAAQRPPDPGPAPGRHGDTVSVDATALPGPNESDDGEDVPLAELTGDIYDDSRDDHDDHGGGRSGGGRGNADRGTATTARRGVLVVGLPLLALAVVVALAWWLGAGVLSVTSSVDDVEGSLPSSSAPAETGGAPEEEPTASGEPVAVDAASVFDPFGDGAPENDDDVPLTFDADPSTAWSTLTYRGSPAFGNLKDGVGIVYDLGSEQELAGATLQSTLPGASVEVRAAPSPEASLEDTEVLAAGTLEESTDFTFDEPVGTRYVLVWVTGLVPSGDGFAADLAEVELLSAG